MRTRAWWTALIGMIVALCIVTNVSAATTYTDPQGRLSFTVPDGYQKTDNASALVAYHSSTYASAAVSLGASGGVAGASLDEGATAILKYLKDTLENFQTGPNGIQSVTVAGKPARRYEFTTTVGSYHARGVQYLTINGDTLYFLTFTASEADFTGFLTESMDILTSFTFLDGSAAGTASTTGSSTDPLTYFIRRLGNG